MMLSLLIVQLILNVAIGQCGPGCPDGENAIHSIDGCGGYYHCVFGEPAQTMYCGTGTLFDPELQICAHAASVVCTCGAAPPPPPTPPAPSPPTTCGSGCPDGFTGILPSTNCAGYYYCVYNSPTDVIECPQGSLFDANLLICAWESSVMCECTDGSAPAPAPSPTTGGGSGCPDGFTGILPSAGCTGYYYCVYNSPTELIECPEGSLFDADLLICNRAESVTCDGGGSSPTPMTLTEPITSPTAANTVPVTPIVQTSSLVQTSEDNTSPSQTATTLSVTEESNTSTSNEPFYPNWSGSGPMCKQDGKQTAWMGDGYLYESEEDCCAANFWWVDTCESAGGGTAPSPGPDPYYPKWSSNTCLNDGKHASVSEIYHYDTLEECCAEHLWWVDTCESAGGGGGTAPSPGPDPYYPKWKESICVNDGGHASISDIYYYESLADCCAERFWWVDACESAGGGGGTAPSPGPNPYYPKWSDERCVNDGGHTSLASVYHFETLEECCDLQFWWSDSCSGGGGGGTTGTNPFYPDWDGETCVNDGGHDAVNPVYHFGSKQECCDLQFWWSDSC